MFYWAGTEEDSSFAKAVEHKEMLRDVNETDTMNYYYTVDIWDAVVSKTPELTFNIMKTLT